MLINGPRGSHPELKFRVTLIVTTALPALACVSSSVTWGPAPGLELCTGSEMKTLLLGELGAGG